MKKNLVVLLMILILSAPAFADAVVKASGEVISAKITAISDDVIYMRKNFVNTIVIRGTDIVRVDDIIVMRSWLAKGEPKRLLGKVYFADADYVKIKITESEMVSIPRIQVKSITVFTSK